MDVLKPRNRLLASLPGPSLRRLLPRLERFDLPLRRTVLWPARPCATVWFPETCLVVLLAVMQDGAGAEVGLIGPEGMVGLNALVDADADEAEGIVLRAGTALALPAGVLREAMDEDPALRQHLLRYALAFHRQVARTAVCNGRHHTEQRLMRWLLMAHDRSEGNEFPMTHEFVAMMLGVRRAGVTVATGALQRAGLVRHERGTITITDRGGLEAATCECYHVVRRSCDALLGPGWDGRPPRA